MKHLLSLIMIVFTAGALSCQSDKDGTHKWSHSVSLIEAYKINERTQFSLPGAEYQLTYAITERIGLQLKWAILNWPDRDQLSSPLTIGINASLMNTKSHFLSAFANAGISGEVGNDYSGFFGAVETGLQIMPRHGNGIRAHLSWFQTMAFHPDHFASIRAGVGYVF